MSYRYTVRVPAAPHELFDPAAFSAAAWPPGITEVVVVDGGAAALVTFETDTPIGIEVTED